MTVHRIWFGALLLVDVSLGYAVGSAYLSGAPIGPWLTIFVLLMLGCQTWGDVSALSERTCEGCEDDS